MRPPRSDRSRLLAANRYESVGTHRGQAHALAYLTRHIQDASLRPKSAASAGIMGIESMETGRPCAFYRRASSGIGAATALAFARVGHDPHIHYGRTLWSRAVAAQCRDEASTQLRSGGTSLMTMPAADRGNGGRALRQDRHAVRQCRRQTLCVCYTRRSLMPLSRARSTQ